MKQILDAVDRPESVIGQRAWQRPSEDMVSIPQANGTTMWLSRKEAAAAGYRQVRGPSGELVVQFGLCRDSKDAWVYAPLRQPEETLEDVMARNAEARKRMGLCRKSGNGQRYAGFDDD